MNNIQKVNEQKYSRGRFAIVLVLFVLIDAVVTFLAYKDFVINSDISNHILEAKDVVHGNFFYRDWNLSQISFLFSDIVFYSLGYLVCGVSRKAAVLCFIIAAIVTQILIYLSCMSGKSFDIKDRIIIAGLIMAPSVSFLSTDTVHFGAWMYCVIGFMLYDKLNKEKDETKYKKLRMALLIIWILGIFSDFLVFLYGALPCVLYSFLRIYRNESRTLKDFKNPLTGVYSFIIAYILEFIYYLVGGANRVGTVAGLEFSDISAWGENITRFIGFLLRSFGADFTGKKALLPDNILRCVNAVMLILALNYLLMTIVFMVKEKTRDRMSEILAIGIIIGTFIFIFTNRSRDNYSILIPVSLYIILARNFTALESWSRHNWKLNRVVFVMLIIMAIIGRGYDTFKRSQTPYYDKHEELYKFLEANGLESGYAPFWDSSICTVLSGERVRIRHIEYGTNGMSEYMWFNKNSWYKEKANFVIIPDTSGLSKDIPIFGITGGNVETYFGKPENILETGEYQIYVYNKDLSKELAEPDSRTQYL